MPEENRTADEENLGIPAGPGEGGIHADGMHDGARAGTGGETPAGSLATRRRLEILLWDLLAAAARGDERARERCKRLKQDWRAKGDALECLQQGALIHWLEDHPRILSGYTPPPDSAGPTEGDQQSSGRVSHITTEWWFQDIEPAIEEDEQADAEARATPDRVELHLYDPPRRSTMMFWSSNVALILHFLDAPNRSLLIPRNRAEIYLPDTPEQWRPDDIDAMRNQTIIVYPANTEGSWNQARSIAQKLQGVAASIRLIDMANPRGHIQNELAACELWGFWLSWCQSGHHWTVGDEHFRNDCKMHQEVRRSEELRAFKARDR